MALGLQIAPAGSGGDFTPIIMYAAREGRFYLRDRVQGSTGAFENEDTELPAGTKMVFDFGAIEVGYLRFAPGMAPSFAVAPLGKPMPASPYKDHRLGFRVMIHLGKNGGIREFATTAKTVIAAIDELHGQFEASPEARTGKIPVVEFTGADRIVTENKHGVQTNFKPRLVIRSWVERPAELGERTVPPPGRSPTPGGASGNGAARGAAPTPRPPARQPQARQAPAAAVADEWDAAAPGGGSIDDEIPFAAQWQ